MSGYKVIRKALQVAGITIICLHSIRIKYSDSVVNGRIKKKPIIYQTIILTVDVFQ